MLPSLHMIAVVVADTRLRYETITDHSFLLPEQSLSQITGLLKYINYVRFFFIVMTKYRQVNIKVEGFIMSLWYQTMVTWHVKR